MSSASGTMVRARCTGGSDFVFITNLRKRIKTLHKSHTVRMQHAHMHNKPLTNLLVHGFVYRIVPHSCCAVSLMEPLIGRWRTIKATKSFVLTIGDVIRVIMWLEQNRRGKERP